jgi:hypothetical protein
MVVRVVPIVMAVGMGMARAVGVLMLVLVEHDLETTAEGVGYAAQRLQARNMIAAFQARDHRLRHLQAMGQLLLRLAGVGAQIEQFARATRGKGGAVIRPRLRRTNFHAVPA